MQEMKRKRKELDGIISHLDKSQGSYLKNMMHEEPSPGSDRHGSKDRDQNVDDLSDLEPVKGANKRADNHNQNVRDMSHEELSPGSGKRSSRIRQDVPDLSHEELTPNEGKSKKIRYPMEDEMNEPESEMEYHKEKMIKPEVDDYGNEDKYLDLSETEYREKKGKDRDLQKDVSDVQEKQIPHMEEATDDEIEELMRRHSRRR